MHIAVCRLTIHMPDNRSLKDKRSVIRSLIDRIRHRFTVAVAEVGDQDRLQVSRVGVAVVSGEARQAGEMIDRVVDYAESRLFEAQIIEVEREVIDMDG